MPERIRTAPPRFRRGFTLIELIVAIVVLGIGVAMFAVLINQSIRQSVDPLVRTQANAIAQSYLEEITLQPFCDPNLFDDCRTQCTSAACTACTISEGGNRAVYNDVCDYNNLPDNQVRDRNNDPIAGLEDYSVTVDVVDSGASLDGLSGNAGQVVRIDIEVTHRALPDPVTLSGYRVNF
jgi:MSHA pilin protein MshD